jgi:hypothetical protein
MHFVLKFQKNGIGIFLVTVICFHAAKMLHIFVQSYVIDFYLIQLIIYRAWFSVFVSRLRYIWIYYIPKVYLEKRLYELSGIRTNRQRKNKKPFFITTNAYYWIEINAHQFTYLALLLTGKEKYQKL